MNPILFTAFAIVSSATILTKRGGTVPAFDYGNDVVRGVNMGGWFVLEPYMSPSLFEAFGTVNAPIDEYRYTQRLGKEEASKRLEQHWDTWIQESDFKQLSDWGFNTVRIPIGYWAFIDRPQDPYVQGQLKYLDRALGWARTHNIKIWIDLHATPGGQNGYDNGGIRDQVLWMDERYPENLNDTYTVIKMMSDRYGGDAWIDTISGIELVNEPNVAIIHRDQLHDYFYTGYDIVRQGSAGQGVIIQDLVRKPGDYNDWLNLPDYYNVVIDHHRYQCFNYEDYDRYNRSIDETVAYTCKNGTEIKDGDNKWRVVGEWSAALTDCTKWLNGVDRGARWDASFLDGGKYGSCANYDDFGAWTDERIADHRKFIEAQLDAWEYGANGWIFWSYKTERSVVWDLRKLIINGVFPNPLDSRKYPNQCGYE